MENENFVYEEAVKELEEIVAKLGAGKVSLDESLELYTRGVELSNACQKRLNEIEQKISIINKDGSVSLLQIEDEKEE